MIYPPRPKHLILEKSLPSQEGKDFVAQPKLNGSNCVLFVTANSYTAYNRHKELMSKQPIIPILELTKGDEMILNGEWLNKNQEPLNNAFCVFDILNYKGVSLVGMDYTTRLAILDAIFGTTNTEGYLTNVLGNIYRVNTYTKNFHQLYQELSKIPLIEGLVLKRKTAKLESGWSENNNSGWQLKIRKPNKNYRA